MKANSKTSETMEKVKKALSFIPKGTLPLEIPCAEMREFLELCETLHHDCCVMREALEKISKAT